LVIDKLKKILRSIRLFSRLVVEVPLREYQVKPADAVADSCLHNKGLEFLLVFPRQSGKDEVLAQLSVFLLTLFQRTEAGLVHVYPTGQQIPVGTTRLENRLDNKLTGGKWWTKSKPTRRGLGQAQIAFFSGHPQARAEGATANLLLIVNEVQDQDEPTVERRFTPMRASTNATAVFVGTVRTTSDYLWRKKTQLEKMQAKDGKQRVFMVTPEQVGAENPHYGDFVANQIAQKGRQHPSVKTELFNEPVDTAAGLFPDRRRALMRGKHKRQSTPTAGSIYVALVDVGGQDEGATSAFADLVNTARDYTVCTIAEVVRVSDSVGPHYQVVDLFTDQGSRHFQDMPGRPALFKRLLAYLEHWGAVGVVCDMTGVGQGLTDALIEKYPRPVFGFDFAKSHNKARLGNDFLAVIETGRFQYFRGDDDQGSAAWWFFEQCRACGYELAEGIPIERGLKWGVSPAVKVEVAGESVPLHDDRLLSAALVAEVDRLYKVGDLFLGTTESAVIRRDI
jgi:hypothetical protein